MRAARTAILTILVIVGAALMLFFIVAEKIRKIIDRFMSGPDL